MTLNTPTASAPRWLRRPDSTQKLDLFDCVRYIADIAQSFGPMGDEKERIPKSVDRLREVGTLLDPMKGVESKDEDFWFPSYDL